ncbi:ABC transporter (plasmid) [Anabaena sp. WA102]|jgi:putative ABC transport system permease protein|uniref:ABC transporter permease DevC n=1 Tax=Anabaena sp. WA102 TaxID=1647413 RepID=UPI0006ABF989|nr:ABC transporter permease DevC [Anabaena sp. WA102]ALB43733.1 ABC transporter [Anabaena sp. WA102]OBQ40843.1 MAG: ABC transporter [Anabaena sp. MDT14b]
MFRRNTPLAWLQLTRVKTRFIVALIGIAFADILMFMQLGFQDGLYDCNTIFHRNLEADIVMLSSQTIGIYYMESFPRPLLYDTLNYEGVESVNSTYVDVLAWKNPNTAQSYPILTYAFDPNKPILHLQGVEEHLDHLKQPDTVLFDITSRPEWGTNFMKKKLEKGESVYTEVNDRRINLAGLFTMGPSFAADANLITSDLNFLRIVKNRSPQQIDVGLINVKLGYNIQKLLEVLRKNLPQKDVKVMTKQEFVDLETKYWAESSPIGVIFGLGVIMGFTVGAVIVYQILYADVAEHLSEYATLKAMGYSHKYLLSLVFQEALILAFFGYLPGYIISLLLYDLTRAESFLPIFMTVNRGVNILILTVLMCFISGVIAVRKLKDADPADVF